MQSLVSRLINRLTPDEVLVKGVRDILAQLLLGLPGTRLRCVAKPLHKELAVRLRTLMIEDPINDPAFGARAVKQRRAAHEVPSCEGPGCTGLWRRSVAHALNNAFRQVDIVHKNNKEDREESRDRRLAIETDVGHIRKHLWATK